MNKEIIVKSSLSVKKSPGLKQIRYSAKAGLSEAEAIERYTIGQYEDKGKKSKRKDEDDKDKKA